jgi:hypothetical protein
MAKHSYVVKVPRPHPKRFEPHRPITDLVRNQLLHLSLAQRHLPREHHHPTDVYAIKTEGEASEFIRHVTSKLHRLKGKDPKPPKKNKIHKSKRVKKTSPIKRKGKGR